MQKKIWKIGQYSIIGKWKLTSGMYKSGVPTRLCDFVLVVRIHLKKRTFLKVRIILLIDWLHIRGHVDPVCQEYCHPAKIPAMKGVNSMVCEQTNYETGRWKYGAKHMSSERYNFFLQYSIIEMKWNLMTVWLRVW